MLILRFQESNRRGKDGGDLKMVSYGGGRGVSFGTENKEKGEESNCRVRRYR